MTSSDPSILSGAQAGAMLGAYRIERLLGRGGMGAVFLAYDTTLHRHVALKVLPQAPGSDESAARLLREARNAAALSHPNICVIHEVGYANDVAFIAMEHVDGQSLHDVLRDRPLPVAEAAAYAVQAADALAYAHDRGVIHRDFKAANIIVTTEGRLKIVDFGLARRSDAAASVATTAMSLVPSGAVAGTPYAMAPEQVRGEAADARTDIWALGVLLTEMFCGRRPFDAPTTVELFSSILRDPPVAMARDLPVELRTTIERCLEKPPERRFQHARELQAPLAAVLARQGATPTTRSGLKIAAMASACVAVAAGIVGWLNVGGVRERIASAMTGATPVALAVMPLENLSGDPEQEYFSDGVTEELITALSRLRAPQLTVVPRTRSARYKRSPLSLDQVGRELNANAVLKGSVSRSGDRVRLVAAMIQAPTGRTLWQRTYDRPVADLVTIGHEISQAVSEAARATLPEPARKELASPRAVNAEAYDLYLRGISHAQQVSEPDVDQAIALLEKSVTIDPAYASALVYLAQAYERKASTYRASDPQWEEKAFATAQKAINLDPEAPEAHFVKGMMLWRPSRGFPSREALQELRLSLDAQPDSDEAWHQHGVILFHVGHLAGARRDIERAVQLNPGNVAARFRFGPINVYEQRFDAALAALDRVPIESFPAQWVYQRAWSLLSLGRLDDAARVIDEALKNSPADQGGVIHSARAMLRARRGDRAGARADIDEAIRVGRKFLHFHHTAYSLGAIYTVLGDFDKAQQWVENAANDGFPNFAFFETDVHLERLRAVPRFRDFLSKLRKEWEHIPGEPD